MSGLLLDLGAAITCPHGGLASPVTGNTRVIVGGTPALLVSDQFPIAGCPLETAVPGGGATPQPCVEAVWTTTAARVLVDGRPVLLSTSTGQCLDAEQHPAGSPVPSEVQPRVLAQ